MDFFVCAPYWHNLPFVNELGPQPQTIPCRRLNSVHDALENQHSSSSSSSRSFLFTSGIMSRPGETQFAGMLKSSASGATLLIMIQLTSRLITFAANQLILRKLSPAILGIATQFELYLATILFFSRESIRVATQRLPLGTIARTDKDSAQTSSHEAWVEDSIASQSVVNVSYLSLGMGIPLAMALSGFYVYFAPERVSEMPYYHAGVATTAVASLLELGVEPFFAVVQQRMLYKKRAAVEMSAAFMKSLVACGMFIWASRIDWDVGVFPFALGYFCHSLVLICGYVITMSSVASKGKFSFLPTRLKSRYARNIH